MNFQCFDREIWIPSGFFERRALCAATFGVNVDVASDFNPAEIFEPSLGAVTPLTLTCFFLLLFSWIGNPFLLDDPIRVSFECNAGSAFFICGMSCNKLSL